MRDRILVYTHVPEKNIDKCHWSQPRVLGGRDRVHIDGSKVDRTYLAPHFHPRPYPLLGWVERGSSLYCGGRSRNTGHGDLRSKFKHLIEAVTTPKRVLGIGSYTGYSDTDLLMRLPGLCFFHNRWPWSSKTSKFYVFKHKVSP